MISSPFVAQRKYRPPGAHQDIKMGTCAWWPRGSCNFGERCSFLHAFVDPEKRGICMRHLRGECYFTAEGCFYSHIPCSIAKYEELARNTKNFRELRTRLEQNGYVWNTRSSNVDDETERNAPENKAPGGEKPGSSREPPSQAKPFSPPLYPGFSAATRLPKRSNSGSWGSNPSLFSAGTFAGSAPHSRESSIPNCKLPNSWKEENATFTNSGIPRRWPLGSNVNEIKSNNSDDSAGSFGINGGLSQSLSLKSEIAKWNEQDLKSQLQPLKRAETIGHHQEHYLRSTSTSNLKGSKSLDMKDSHSTLPLSSASLDLKELQNELPSLPSEDCSDRADSVKSLSIEVYEETHGAVNGGSSEDKFVDEDEDDDEGNNDQKIIKEWDCEDVYEFVKGIGQNRCWSQYADRLREEEVDGLTLGVYVDYNYIVEDHPIIKKGHARVLANAIRKLRKK
mmetsp:Transcript_123/g.295  ORF Transcript_123/g.295 Transcript_123/m.295 type:complete len:451 (+) Transcript_123:200-1552(+)|eukprot:CAMPEP_0114507874 /NCGR_PEP_ID=MMETSP0109-20121206/12265_1 /TAXON_ID=29199 /ORGANISM="Chlorarachnion reptans, Strain CCCM449" /LENGTH=450 /DNA_ID=CAMNT_0001686701 /DNA_START=142 /DNA_END=1494 /DNA_ORIENTATION=-